MVKKCGLVLGKALGPLFVVLCLSICPAGTELRAQQAATCRPPWMPASVPDICEWHTTTSLPDARAYASARAAFGRIYIAGGFHWDAASGTAHYYDDVLSAAIAPDGKVGAWERVADFQQGRSGLAMAIVKDCIVLTGGSWSTASAASYSNGVHTGRVSVAGEPLTLATSPSHLKTPRANHALVTHETPSATYLYVVGGVTEIGKDTVHLDTIEYAQINEGCSVGPWMEASFHIKGGRSTPGAVVVGDRLYVIGGWGDLDFEDVYRDVQYATLEPDGSVAPWRNSSNVLPTGIYGHTVQWVPGASGAEGMLLAIGGQPSVGLYSTALIYSYVQPGQLPRGVPGPWTTYHRGLPGGRAGHAQAFWDGYIYLLGGSDGVSDLQQVIAAPVRPGKP